MATYLAADTVKAVLLGHAVGDALGVPVEFTAREKLDRDPVTDMRGFGSYPYPAGTWSDDTSMTLCALEVLAKGTVDFDRIMQNFGEWLMNGAFTASGEAFDSGRTCVRAISRYFRDRTKATESGGTDEYSNGNGSLMRILPVALYAVAVYGTKDLRPLWRLAAEGSSLTHAHPRSQIACQIYATVLACLIERPTKQSIADGIAQYRAENGDGGAEAACFGRVDAEILKSLNRSEIRSDGYVIDTLEAALWCLLTTDSYAECVLRAVNLGDDTDTAAAVAGGLAGALYGWDAIPKAWLRTLQRCAYLESLCEQAAENWGKGQTKPLEKA